MFIDSERIVWRVLCYSVYSKQSAGYHARGGLDPPQPVVVGQSSRQLVGRSVNVSMVRSVGRGIPDRLQDNGEDLLPAWLMMFVRSFGRSVGWPGRSIKFYRSVGWPVGVSVVRSINRSVERSIVSWSVGRSVGPEEVWVCCIGQISICVVSLQTCNVDTLGDRYSVSGITLALWEVVTACLESR